MHVVGLFEAKTHLSAYVARAEAGEEVIITRHNKPVARLVPMKPMALQAEVDTPPFVQRTFDMGQVHVDLRRLNQLSDQLEDADLLSRLSPQN